MRDKLIYVLGAIAAILFVRNLNTILNVLPDEAQQGAMYRIMFFHIPSWWTAMIAATVACYTNIAYLATGKLKYDAWSLALTEVQLPILFTGLATGMIWGRIIWGIWWTWDARLTSALVYVLLCCGYVILRSGIADPTQRAKIAAVFSLFAYADVPIVWLSIRLWRTQHPSPMTLPTELWHALLWNWLAIVLLMIMFLLLRLRQEEMRRELDGLRRLAHAG
jgi:heme exporter protein C